MTNRSWSNSKRARTGSAVATQMPPSARWSAPAAPSRRHERELRHRAVSVDVGDEGHVGPTPLTSDAVNHRPPGPLAIQKGNESAVGTGYSVNVPVRVSAPIWLASRSVNQIRPSGQVDCGGLHVGCGNGELGDRPGDGHPTDAVAGELREPQRTV